MTRTVLCLVLLLLGCDAPVAPDAGRPDAPRPPDAGFDPAVLAACTPETSLAFDGAPHASYVWLDVTPTARRLFYPLAVLDEDGSASEPPAVVDAARAAALTAADCGGDAGCIAAALSYDPDEARAAGVAVAAALAPASLGSVAAHLRGSGTCARSPDESDAGLVADCVEDVLLGLSTGLGVLGEIAAADLDARMDEIAAEAPTATFHHPLTALLERALVLADRSEPVRYEPLDEENAPALAALASTDFDAFPFAAIVVPGQGPNDGETALHPAGRARADLGHDRWAAGLAPVVLVSGGHVHPDRTIYSEAVEMRRYLVEERGMPASAVLIDPYARHTTTNLRNATRILVRAGVPADRPILITSDFLQSAYIASPGFATRCEEELSFRPFAGMQRLSDLDACLLPVAASLGLAPSDPLDP